MNKYPKLSLITAITFLLGMHPLHEHRKDHWLKKIILPGLILAMSHSFLIFYAFLMESKRVGFFNSNPNNIIQATLVLKRLLAVLTPLVCIFGKLCYIKSWAEYWHRIDIFDEIIKSADHQEAINFRCSVADLEEKIRRTNFYCGLCVILVETFNYGASYLYYTILSPTEMPQLETIYFYHFASSTLISSTINISAHMLNIKLRFRLLSKFLDSVWSMAWPTEDLISNRQRLLSEFQRDEAFAERAKGELWISEVN